MPPRKRRRSAWSAISETNGVSYTPCHTRMTHGSDGVLHLTLSDARLVPAPKPVRTLFASDDIAEFRDETKAQRLKPPVIAKTNEKSADTNEDDVVLQSFESDLQKPLDQENVEASAIADSIEESPSNVNHTRREDARKRTEHIASGGSKRQLPESASSVAPSSPPAFVARALLPAMEQEGPSAVQPNVDGKSMSGPSLHTTVAGVVPAPALITPNAQRKPLETGTSPNSSAHYTPLMITSSAIRRAQVGLGLTPDTPGRTDVVLVNRELEEELRAIQASARKMMLAADDVSSAPPSSRRETPLKPLPGTELRSGREDIPTAPKERDVSPKKSFAQSNAKSSTPAVAKRRLSEMSAVTPIPLNLESPAASRGAGRGACTTAAQSSVPLFTNGKGVPLQATGRTHLASPITPGMVKRDFNPLPGPPAKVDLTPKAGGAGSSLFTTGKGVPVRLPIGNKASHQIHRDPVLPQSSGSKLEVAPPLFTTGSGKKVSMPTASRCPGALPKALDVASLFSTGNGKPVSVLDQKKITASRLLSRPPPSPHGHTLGQAASRKGSLRETEGTEQVTPQGHGRKVVRNGNSRSRGALKTTPFKRPRQVSRPQFIAEKAGNVTRVSSPVPKFEVPPLLRTGLFSCSNPSHQCQSRAISQSCALPYYLTSVGCLEKCLAHTFSRTTLGNISCHAPEVLKVFNTSALDSFGVESCIQWTRKLFPDVSSKPATCTGSVAWTKLAYALAVWKLGRLDEDYNRKNGATGCRFLCAANVIREFLRRISYEWHKNRQPHLLRIMRRDSAVASHVILLVADLEELEHEGLVVTLTDGWYVARANVDKFVEKRFRRGWIRIGDKIHLSGAGLESVDNGRTFFFGEGDELSNARLKIQANNVRKRLNASSERLGIQRYPLITNSLKSLIEDGGQCPAVKAVILRSYPVFYTEIIAGEDDEAPTYVLRREDAEIEASAAHEEQRRQKRLAIGDAEEKASTEVLNNLSTEVRTVRSTKEILTCGVGDDPTDKCLRKVIRVYNPSEDVETYLSQEGEVLFLSQMWPKKHAWNCRPQGVMMASKQRADGARLLRLFPRRVYSLQELSEKEICSGDEFDGIFCVLHVCDVQNEGRFVYFVDDVDNDIGVLALEMSGYDSRCLPPALRFKPGMGRGTKFPLVVLRDIEFIATNRALGLVHARATLHSSFTSYKSFVRKRGASPVMKDALSRLGTEVYEKEPQLEVLRDAVISFSSGDHRTIGAYFTSTQDM